MNNSYIFTSSWKINCANTQHTKCEMDFKFYFCEIIASRSSYEPYVHTNSEQWIKWIVNNLTPELRDEIYNIFNVSVHLFRFLWSTISVAVVVHARGCAWTQKTRENEALVDHEVIRTNDCDSMLRMRSAMHQWKVYFYWLFAMRRNLHATFRLRSKVFRTWQTCGDVFSLAIYVIWIMNNRAIVLQSQKLLQFPYKYSILQFTNRYYWTQSIHSHWWQ